MNAIITSEAHTGTYLATGESSPHHLPPPSTDLSVVKLKTTFLNLKKLALFNELLLFNEVIGSQFKFLMWEV